MGTIRIKLRSDLCAGDGASRGNRVDTDICMNPYGLPYIPARRLKGCLRAAAVELNKMGHPAATEDRIRRLFGDAHGVEGSLAVGNAEIEGALEAGNWIVRTAHGKNEVLRRAVHPMNISGIYTYVRGQTSLQDGVKVDGTLRFTNVLKRFDPLSLNKAKEMVFTAAAYAGEDEGLVLLLKDACKALRHIGLQRNRGLGNVSVTYEERLTESSFTEVEEAQEGLGCEEDAPGARYRLTWYVAVDAPLSLPDCDEINTAVPARSVIGCLAGQFHHLYEGLSPSARNAFTGCGEAFRKLFLSGDVCFSQLTPVIGNAVSEPVPLTLVKLKNGGGRMINRLAEKEDTWKQLKPKTMEGKFAAVADDGYTLAGLTVRTSYHNSISGTGLYMQESLDPGILLGGTVEADSQEALALVRDLLKRAELRFGRSRNAQYAACHLVFCSGMHRVEDCRIAVNPGEKIYVVLSSDMALESQRGAEGMSPLAVYVTEPDELRDVLAQKLELDSALPYGEMDFCRYRTIGGFQNRWNLQKPHVPVLCGGSVLCFTAAKTSYPAQIRVGEFQQEGFGICRLFTEEGMRRMNRVESGQIDVVSVGENEHRQEELRDALLVNLCMEAIKERARSIASEAAGLPVGRMRLLMTEARDYASLRAAVDDMKESDVDSRNRGKKYACNEFLDRLYGGRSIDVRELISAPVMWEEIKTITTVQEALEIRWKEPLDVALHSLHYGKNQGGRR